MIDRSPVRPLWFPAWERSLACIATGWFPNMIKYVRKHNLTSMADPLCAIERLGRETLQGGLLLLWLAHDNGSLWCLGVQPHWPTCLVTFWPPILTCRKLKTQRTQAPRMSWQHDLTSTKQFRKCSRAKNFLRLITDMIHGWLLKPLANVSQVLARLVTGSCSDSLGAVWCGPLSSLKMSNPIRSYWLPRRKKELCTADVTK